MKSGPQASRTRRTISTAKRMRCAASPPQASLRRLVRGAVNWLMQVALGAHQLDAVVAGFAGELRGARVRVDLAFDAARRQRARRERIDRRLELRRRDRQRVVARSARHAASAGRCCAPCACTACVTWRCGRTSMRHDSLPANGFSQPTMLGAKPPVTIRPDAAGRALGEIRRELREVARAVLEPRVHRAHQHPVAQRAKPRSSGANRCG